MKQYNYDRYAELYDLVELKNNDVKYRDTNNLLKKILRKNKVRTVFDMTCGTGLQAVGLSNMGFKVTASDLSKGMVKVAKKRSGAKRVKFMSGDIRRLNTGKFDAVIAMFNAVGHLNENGLRQALKNVKKNLNRDGIFIFDIFNLDFMRNGGFYGRHEFMDFSREIGDKKYVRFNKNDIDYRRGMMKIRQRTLVQKDHSKPEVIRQNWDMKLYTPKKLMVILNESGYKAKFYDITGKSFNPKKSISILAVCKIKQN